MLEGNEGIDSPCRLAYLYNTVSEDFEQMKVSFCLLLEKKRNKWKFSGAEMKD